jgi:hypothetical protein
LPSNSWLVEIAPYTVKVVLPLGEDVAGLWQIIKVALIALGVLLFLGLGIGSNTPMPAYAPVYIDDGTRTYLAAPCKSAGMYSSDINADALRFGTKSEARRLGYKPDDVCRNTGIHAPDERSATGHLLQWLGLLPPLKHWWDEW